MLTMILALCGSLHTRSRQVSVESQEELDVVTFNTMPHCLRGEHDQCPGLTPAPADDEFSGWICDCECHHRSKTPGTEDLVNRTGDSK